MKKGWVLWLLLIGIEVIGTAQPQSDVIEPYSTTPLPEEAIDWLCQRLSEERSWTVVQAVADALYKLDPQGTHVVRKLLDLLRTAHGDDCRLANNIGLALKNYDARKLISQIPLLVAKVQCSEVGNLLNYIGKTMTIGELGWLVASEQPKAVKIWVLGQLSRRPEGEVKPLVPELIKAFETGDHEIKQYLLNIIKKLGEYLSQRPEEANALVLEIIKSAEVTKSGNAYAMLILFEAIGKLPRSGLEKAIELLQHEDQAVKRVATNVVKKNAQELKELTDRVVDLLIPLLDEIPEEAALALAEIGEPARKAIHKLISLLSKHPDSSAIASAVFRLAPAPEEEIATLEAILTKTRWYSDATLFYVFAALMRSGPKGEEKAMNVLEKGWLYISPWHWGVLAAEFAPPERCNARLANYFLQKHKNKQEIRDLFRHAALDNCLTPEIQDEIDDCKVKLRLKNPAERIEAANTLSWMGPVAKSAYPDVLKALQTERVAEVRIALCSALKEMGPPEEKMLPELLTFLTRAAPEVRDDSRVRRTIVEIMGSISAELAVKYGMLAWLQEIASMDPNEEVRAAAVGALAQILQRK